MSPVIRTRDLHDSRARFLDRRDAVLAAAAWREAESARNGRRGLATHHSWNRTLLRVRLLGLRAARQGHAAANGSTEETGCRRSISSRAKSDVLERCVCDAGEAAVFRYLALVELAVVFFVGVNLFVLFFEEPALRQKFGAEYEEYCRRVARWLPRLKTAA